MLGTPGLPIGSLRGGGIPGHEKSLFSVTPVGPHGKGWSVGQLKLILLNGCDPRAAAESKPESRTKPRRTGGHLEQTGEGDSLGSPPTSRSRSPLQRKVILSTLSVIVHCA